MAHNQSKTQNFELIQLLKRQKLWPFPGETDLNEKKPFFIFKRDKEMNWLEDAEEALF